MGNDSENQMRGSSAPHAEDLNFFNFMGDEQQWSGLVEDFWLVTHEHENLSQRLLSGSPMQVWTGILHLLYLGLGWENPGLGLKSWRLEGFQNGLHPVLDLVWEIAGDDTVALELFLRNCSLEMNRGQGPYSGAGGKRERDDFESWAKDHLRDRRLSSLGTGVLPVGGWDPLHLSTHLEQSFRETESTWRFNIQSDNYATSSEKYAILIVDKYAGWHHHLRPIDAELNRSGVSSSRVDVGVKILGMNKLGDFRYCDQTGLWYLIGADSRAEDIHLWGNMRETQTPRELNMPSSEQANAGMNKGTNKQLASFQIKGKALSILVREEVGLAHTMQRELLNENGETSYLFYKNDGWQNESEWENNRHYNACLLALMETKLIDPELLFVEAVQDGSLILEVQPWADEMAIRLWGSSSRFPHFLAELLTLQANQMISINDLEPNLAKQAVELRDIFAGKAKRSKDNFFLMGLEEFVESAGDFAVYELLESIAETYEYFGDN